MEQISHFCKSNKNQLQSIYDKEHCDVNTKIICINYSKIEDIKVTCLLLNNLSDIMKTNLEDIKKKCNNNNNRNYAFLIKDKDVNIIKLN